MNFNLSTQGEVSTALRNIGITDFEAACSFIAHLPYRRNNNKHNILCVLNDKAGTCSTKHALLRKLALENNHSEVKLMLGIFKMDKAYSSKLTATLSCHGLDYLPEAHNYLKINGVYYDFTTPNATYAAIDTKILLEQELEFHQIGDEKVHIHKDYLKKWMVDNPTFDLETIWTIREQCIADLQQE